MRAACVAIVATALLLGGTSPVAAATAPTLISPGDGSDVIGTEATLRVAVEGDVDVRFEGRREGATSPGAAAGDAFTLVAIPDIQNYTSGSRAATIRSQAQWVLDTRAERNTQFVVQLGDLVSSLSWAGHWPYASNGLKVLDDAGMPNAVVAGNHDFHTDTGAYSEYDAWFPPSRYANASWTPSTASYGGYMGQDQFGDDPVDRGNMNNYSLFSAGGIDWLVLGLEWEAPTASLEWADRVLDAHPDRTVIMFTHAFLTEGATRRTTPQRPGGTAPERIWQEFVRDHCAIRLVLNGHESGSTQTEARRTDLNACGDPVAQILSNYQTRPNGGDGWMRAYRIDPTAGTLVAQTYSPTLGTYETDANSAFTMDFPLVPAPEAPFEEIATVAASGGQAEATWSGLQLDAGYEWRAVAIDGAEETPSATWTLNTIPEPQTSGLVDTFTRTVSSGWGDSDNGRTWTVSSASSFAVDGAAGRVTVAPGAQRTATVDTGGLADVDAALSYVMTPTASGSGTYLGLLARQSAAGDYRAKVTMRSSGTATLAIVRRAGGAETVLASTTLPDPIRGGDAVSLRLTVTGTDTVTVRAKAWQGATEPSGWSVSATDASAARITSSGGVGLWTYASGASGAPAVIRVDEFTASGPGAPPQNLAPTARVALVGTDERTVDFSGAASTDADGEIVQWRWAFGDGATASGPTASHTYAADGAYRVTLTVRDDDGAEHSASIDVDVATAPPTGGPLAIDGFARSVTGGWGLADVGGPWQAVAGASAHAVGGGAAAHTLSPGASAAAWLSDLVTAEDLDVRVDVSWSRNASQGTLWAGVAPRAVSTSTDYRIKLNVSSSQRLRLDAVRRLNGAETVLASAVVPGLTIAAGQSYAVIARVTATASGTVLQAKVFPAGTAEPAGWHVSAPADSTATLQQPGRVLLWSYSSGSATAPLVASWDDFAVTAVP